MTFQAPNQNRLEIPIGYNFGAVYADPPWPLDQPNTMHARRRIHYDRMSADEIKSMGDSIKDATHPDAHLWLWTTNAHLKLALDVVDAWGFNYKTLATWRKSKVGLGWWLRSRTEHLILAARTDKLRHNPGSFTTEIVGEWRGHSKKPDDVHEMIERLSPGPYLELFSRSDKERENWLSLGSDRPPNEAFGQIHKRPGARPDPGDGRVRGVGGLEINIGEEYVKLEKILIAKPCVAVEQRGRRVHVIIDGVKKSVSIDSLRAKGYEV